MNIINTNFSLAELCDQFTKKDLLVNKDYQRSDEVWPDFARSLLIETIILGYPMPKLTIRQTTDMKSLKTFKEIVDGQQRTKAIVDFFHGEYSLSPTLETAELRGRSVHDLDEVDRGKFVTYSVGADLLVGASDEEVIEVFRRMNSYTAPLNPEEQRHAVFQGKFKWFVHDMRRSCERAFTELGVFREKSFVRMQDAKLLTELSHAVLHGIQTTNKKHLDSVYNSLNKTFQDEDKFRSIILNASEFIRSRDPVSKSPLAKPYNFYALALAVIHCQSPVPTLSPDLTVPLSKLAPENRIDLNLSLLSEALADADNPPPGLESFVDAASEKTNVKAQRVTRFNWFYKALTDQME